MERFTSAKGGPTLLSRGFLAEASMRCWIALVISSLLVAALFAVAPAPGDAWAQEQPGRPSLLIVDAGLGDGELAGLHWLGEGAELVSEESGRTLLTSGSPLWWQSGESSAPATFLLYRPTGGATTADDIVWALDEIRESGAEPRTFALAMGGTGLALREYAEDLLSSKQSARADLVGMGFCGTPQNGYSAIELYPEQDLWEALSQAAGLSVDDLVPQSAYLAGLNDAKFPSVTKTLSVSGAVGDLGFGLTDGAGATEDFALSGAVSDQVVTAQAVATVSQQMNLTGYWEPFTSSINYSGRAVDAQLAERLSAIASYEVSDDVQEAVRGFYDAWFADGCPVTHNSNVLLLDLSGSMVESIDAGGDKLSAAKEAAAQYLQAMASCSELPQAAPADVSIFGFNEVMSDVASGFDQTSIDALGCMNAQNETNIGIALDCALASLADAPTCADKHILLLSDGESTRGMSDEEMLAGPVVQAAAEGVVIDAIGFGDVGESDAGFLEQVAQATGGAYYQASDTYSLKVNFLKSYYSSLGLSLVDEELAAGSVEQEIGAVDAQTSALEVGVVGDSFSPDAKLLRNGVPLDDSQFSLKQENGLVFLQCVNPPEGEYSLSLSGDAGAAHVFAVKQQGIAHAPEIAGEQADYSLFLLIGAGALLLVAVVAVVVRAQRRPKAASSAGEAGGR